jgi:hypothetical protein
MVETWKASRASNSAIEVHQHMKDDDATAFSEDDESDYTSSGYSYSEEEEDVTEMINSNISHGKQFISMTCTVVFIWLIRKNCSRSAGVFSFFAAT